MSTPDLTLWTNLLFRIAVEAACVIAFALVVERRVQAVHWRRALWQSAIVCLLCLTLSELTGFGRGLATYLFGHTRPETKYVVTASSEENSIEAPSPMPSSFSAAPAILSISESPMESVRPVWWPGIVWLTGTVLIASRVAVSQILFVSLRRSRRKITAKDLDARVADILRQLGCRRKIRLIECPKLASPIAFGIVRPSIGLPSNFTANYSEGEQDAMLAHELAHLASRDPLWYLLADTACALSWWHPSAWWARRRLQHASELAADEAAAIVPGGPAILAECLTTLGRQMTQRPTVLTIGVEGRFRSSLAERVQRLLRMNPKAQSPAFGGQFQAAGFAAIFTVCAVAIVLTGCVQNRDAVKQATLQASLSQSWEASAASSVWHSAHDVRQLESAVASKAVPAFHQLPPTEEQLPPTTNLETRKLHLSRDLFLEALQSHTTNTASNNYLIARYFGGMGINLTNNGATVFFNRRTGELLVRATHPDLDKLEGIIEVLNQVPPLIQVDVKFVSAAADDAYKGLGFDWLTPAKPIRNTNDWVVVGLLHEAQFRATIQALEQRNGVDILSAPRVIVENGRQAHVETDLNAVQDVNEIVTTFPRDATATNLSHSINQGVPSSPAAITNSGSLVARAAMDLLPKVTADGYFIQTTLIQTYPEFLGYDSPGSPSSVERTDPPGLPGSIHSPLPHYRVRQSVITTNIFDGDTIVMRKTRPSADANPQPDMLIFVTPRIVDPAGQPVHRDEVLKASLPANSSSPTETSVPR